MMRLPSLVFVLQLLAALLTSNAFVVSPLTMNIGQSLPAQSPTIPFLSQDAALDKPVQSLSSLWVSVGNGTIDWSNPVEAFAGGVTLLYIGFSIWAGLKYILKDGWRPKL